MREQQHLKISIIMLISLIPIIYSKNKEIKPVTENKLTISQRIINISIVLVFVGLFWAIYQLGDIRTIDLQLKMRNLSTLNIPTYLWSSLETIFILPIGILAIILWTFFYNSQIFKLAIGFMFAAISFGVLFLIPEFPGEHHIILYLLSLLFLGISEVHLEPIAKL